MEKFRIFLLDAGITKIATTKCILEYKKISLKDAKEIIDQIPCCIAEIDNKEEAENLKYKLEQCGASIKIEVERIEDIKQKQEEQPTAKIELNYREHPVIDDLLSIRAGMSFIAQICENISKMQKIIDDKRIHLNKLNKDIEDDKIMLLNLQIPLREKAKKREEQYKLPLKKYIAIRLDEELEAPLYNTGYFKKEYKKSKKEKIKKFKDEYKYKSKPQIPIDTSSKIGTIIIRLDKNKNLPEKLNEELNLIENNYNKLINSQKEYAKNVYTEYVKKYKTILNPIDWGNIDILMFYIGTMRADTIKDALLLHEQKKDTQAILNEISATRVSLVSEISKSSQILSSSIIKVGNTLINQQNNVINCLNECNKNLKNIENDLSITISQNDMILDELALNNALQKQANKTSEKILKEIQNLDLNVSVTVY